MKKTKFIVITSINEPGQAIQEFANWKDWQLIVVGDRKSSKKWHYPGVIFLDIDFQHKNYKKLSTAIPENTYCRKLFGYIYAIQHGAEVIFESDDDNIPYKFGKDVLNKFANYRIISDIIASKNDWVNIYKNYSKLLVWPRGYPISLINENQTNITVNKRNITWGVLQFLADYDPDVDAIYRMVVNKEVNFEKNKSFLLAKGSFCPFNSQATLWLKPFFPLMFFPLSVPDRVTDILRGYIALVSLWRMNSTLAFHSPIVYQRRNFHNLLDDFKLESQLYLNTLDWAKLLLNIQGKKCPDLYAKALKILIDNNYLSKKNTSVYKYFLQEIF